MIGELQMKIALCDQIELIKIVSKKTHNPGELAALSEALAHLSEVYISLIRKSN